MNQTILAFLLAGSVAFADFADDAVPAVPDILNRIISGAERSGEPLSSQITKGEPTVYYLKRAEYVGECTAPFGPVHIARLFFIRSGVRGQATPPPRGHTFIVFYDAKFKVRGFWRDADGPFSTRGSKLFEGDKELFDYAGIPERYEDLDTGAYPKPPVWK